MVELKRYQFRKVFFMEQDMHIGTDCKWKKSEEIAADERINETFNNNETFIIGI